MNNFNAYPDSWMRKLNQPIVLSRTTRHRMLAAVIAIFTITTMIHSLAAIPVFEGYDEQRHYAYARYLANNYSLPPRTPLTELEYNSYKVGQTSGNPPLYYIPVALLTTLVPNADDVAPYVIQNSFNNFRDDLGLLYDNHNRYLHGTEGQFPFQGVSLAVHLGRLVSVIFGALTLLGVYGIARTLIPARPAVALLATGLVGGIPRFIYLHAIITNDTAVILFTTLSIWMAMRIAREGPSLRLGLLGSLFAGFGLLSKLNGAWAAGIVWLALFVSAFIYRRGRPLRSSLLVLLASIGVLGLITGWWFAYGALNGGDLLGTSVHAVNAGHTIDGTFWSNLADWENTTWGAGWPFPQLFRYLYLVGLASAMAKALVTVVKQRGLQSSARDLRPQALQAACFLLALGCAIAGGIYWQLDYGWRLGRLLYPSLTGAAVFAAIGWGWCLDSIFHWQRLRWSFAAYRTSATALVLVILATVGFSTIQIIQVYEPHPTVPLTAPGVIRTELTFLDPADSKTPVAEVIGYRLPAQDLRPGATMLADLCWRSSGYNKRSFPYALQLVGPNDVQPGTRNSYHGLGSYPLIDWKPGEEFCDPTSLRVFGDIDRPRAYKLIVTLFQLDPVDFIVGPTLTAIDGTGQPAYPMIGRVRVAPAQMPQVTPTVSLGSVAGLAGTHIELRPGNILSVTLRWVALDMTETDANVFLHVLDPASGRVIAQDDHQPDAGWFPTNYWHKGDVIDDHFEIKLPAGTSLHDSQLRLGMYDTHTQQRLEAIDLATRTHLANDVVPVN
jgi:Dolichyl-phosphate-mannose-protein mannosyltransferase